MKFIIERAPLVKALGHLQSVVERRNTIPILSNIMIEAKGGRIRMTATDLDIQVVDSVEADVQVEGTTTVGAHTLQDIVRKMPDGSQISIEVAEQRMAIVAGRSRFRLPVLPAEDFPQIAVGELDHHITVSTEALRDAIIRTRYAVSTEETRYYLNGIYMHATDEGLQAVATDGHRLARNKVHTGDAAITGMPNVIVPRKAVAELAKIVSEYDGDVEVGLSRNKISFEIGDINLVTKAIDGTFPDYTRVIPTSNGIIVKVDAKSFAEAVDRVTTVATEKTRAVKVNISKTQITISVTSPENGTATEDVPCDSTGEVEIGFNAKYLLEILSQVGSETVELRLADAAAPVLLLDANHESDVAVLMPMRV